MRGTRYRQTIVTVCLFWRSHAFVTPSSSVLSSLLLQRPSPPSFRRRSNSLSSSSKLHEEEASEDMSGDSEGTRRRRRRERSERKLSLRETGSFDHKLLTRAEEVELGRSLDLARCCQVSLQRKLKQRRQEYNDQLLRRRLELEWMPTSQSSSSFSPGDASWHDNADIRRLNADFYNEDSDDYNEYDGMEFFSVDRWRHQEPSSPLDLDDVSLSPEDRLEDFEGKLTRMEKLAQDVRTLLTHEDAHQISNGTVTTTEDLMTLLQAGEEARQLLLGCNMRLVWSIARRWQRMTNTINIPLEPIVQEGVLGLQEAVDRFDFTRGTRFSTYATVWITSWVRKAVYRRMSGAMNVPVHFHHLKRKYVAIRHKYVDFHKEEPTFGYMAKELKVTPKLLKLILKRTAPSKSLDEPLVHIIGPGKGSNAGGGSSGMKGLSYADVLPCPDAKPDEMMDQVFLRNALENAMAKELSPHERDIIRLRLGLDDGTVRSVQEVADIFSGPLVGYSADDGVLLAAEDVRSTERSAYLKLRRPTSLQAHRLDQFLYIVGIDRYSALHPTKRSRRRRRKKDKKQQQP